MSSNSVKGTFAKWCETGHLPHIYSTPISAILDTVCPDTMEYLSNRVVMHYIPENVWVLLDNSYQIIIHEPDKTPLQFKFAHSDYLKKLQSIVDVRSHSLQAITIRSILDKFKISEAEWHGTLCSIPIDVNTYKVVILVSPQFTDIEFRNSSGTSITAYRNIQTANTKDILSWISFYCKTTDKTFITPDLSHAEDADAPNLKCMETENVQSLNEDTNNMEPVSNHSVDYSSIFTRKEKSHMIDVDRACQVLEELSEAVDKNWQGSFADGWKEAISAMTNRLRTL